MSEKHLFEGFVEVCESIRSTSSKNKKVSILAHYLATLDEDSVQTVSHYLSGRIFPRWYEKEVNVGYRTIVETIHEISGGIEGIFSSTYLKHGDLGSTAEELLSKRTEIPLFSSPLTLNCVSGVMREIAEATGKGSGAVKRNLVKGLLLSASPGEAKYLVKVLTGELRIGLVEGLLEEAAARAFGCSTEEVRRASMVLGDIGLAAVEAKRGSVRRVAPELGRPLGFMLADTMQTAEEIHRYFQRKIYIEYKYDGVRAQIHKDDSNVRIFSRRLEDVSRSFPEITAALSKTPGRRILDGEIVAFNRGKPLSFQGLQQRLRRKNITPKLIEEIPVWYFAFDLIFSDGKSLLDMPLEQRRRLLDGLSLKPPLAVSHMFEAQEASEIQRLFEQSREEGFEGLVVKDPASGYSPGRRGKHWVKLKRELDTLDVVIVAAEWGHGKRAGVLSDYTFAVKDDGELKVIGKAYSGLTDEEILQMTEELKAITVRDLRYKRIVEPKIVLEVAFDNIQQSSRHDSGYALRFPRIKRIRTDRSVDDVDTFDKVKEIVRRQQGLREDDYSAKPSQ